MYEFYTSSSKIPVKFNIYSHIFNNEFNIGFFKPIKDLCDKCELFKTTKEPSPDDINKHDHHIRQKELCKNERDRDRTRFLNDVQVGIVTFELQNTFSLPKANVSNFYYKTKRSCYNLTAHLSNTKVVYNALWHEFSAGRGANHIAAAIFKILTQIMIDNPQLKSLILWSDSCVPQNKNSIMSFALQYFLNSIKSKDLETIEQKFSEPGHGNIQEIDNAHSLIEKHIRNIEIWSPISLVRQLLLIPSSWKLKFKVIQMQPNDYFDFQKISKALNYKTIPYTRLKHIIYNKGNINNIEFREKFEGDFTKAKMYRFVSRKKNEIKVVPYHFSEELPVANQEFKIAELKRKHLSEIVSYVPHEDEKAFYNALLSNKKSAVIIE
ncbi:uncharacterized protein [Onthophagus taurus]|uniref:uncharacterized protein isoform X1 n=1 Tax=Onthophagus taurus TaxID=166361 RepID=UPI0039BE6C0A